MDLYVQFPICLHGVALDYLSTEGQLTFTFPFNLQSNKTQHLRSLRLLRLLQSPQAKCETFVNYEGKRSLRAPRPPRRLFIYQNGDYVLRVNLPRRMLK